MPKVIKNLRDNILTSAKSELFRCGYADLNMRNIAKMNNTAVGTIYNYFASKDVLIASVILTDWLESIKKIHEVSITSSTVEIALENILENINSFYSTYRDIFKSSGLTNIRTAFPDKYDMLIKTVGDEIKRTLDRFNIHSTDFEISFIVTNIFAAVTNNWPFEQTIQVLNKIVKES